MDNDAAGAGKKGKDLWDKADVILKPVGGLLTAVTVGILGYYTSDYLKRNETLETNTRVYSELMSRREQAESELRKDMFISIINTFLKPQPGELESQVLNLELLAYNFHESLNLKPLFAHLRKQINASPDRSRSEYVRRLESVAREITRKQMLVLEEVGRRFDSPVDLEQLRQHPEGVPLESRRLTLDGVQREFTISVTGADLGKKELAIEMEVRTLKDNVGETAASTSLAFHVGHFDFPMIDNTRLSRDQRFAVVLNHFEDAMAEITLVFFPGSYASLKERPYYEEVIEKLRRTSAPAPRDGKP